MSKEEKIVSLQKYVATLKTRLTNVPERRLHQKEEYLQWLNREIKTHEAKINLLRS